MFDRLSDVASRKATAVDAVFEVLSDWDSKYWATLFYGTSFVYVARVVYQSLGYSRKAQLFPLIVGSVLLGMLALKMTFLLIPERYTPHFTGVFDSIGSEFGNPDQDAEVDEATQYRQEFVMILWLTVLVPVIWLFGFLKTLPVFVFTFVYVYERSVARAAVVTVAAATLVYALFVVLLDAQVYRGVVQLPVLTEVLP